MAVWLVRCGRHGEDEAWNWDQNVVAAGYAETPDLTHVQSEGELDAVLEHTYPDDQPKTRINWRGQLWAFVRRMQPGDLVVVPLKTRPSIFIGTITGPYRYRAEEAEGRRRHSRPVAWRGEWPRTAFEQDLLYSFGAFMNVCRIARNDAETRIRHLIEGAPAGEAPSAPIVEADWDELSTGQIQTYIARHFKGHALADLVAVLLNVRGYHTRTAPPGADGGVDILAGQGRMGFEAPRLAVQVKSGADPVDITVLHQLQGAMRNVGADQGLLVSLGGFKRSVLAVESTHFFAVRLWDAKTLLDELLACYDQLPDEWRRRIPLKRLWMLDPGSGAEDSPDPEG